jgi:glycosyltransferase involved in cell wall biosynthesis
VDPDLFAPREMGDGALPSEPDMLQGIPHPRVLYVGVLSGWFQAEWVRFAAERLPNHHFVLVGPRDMRWPELENKKNVHFLGPRPASQMPDYCRASDSAIIPFRRSNLVDAVCPVKLYEYLAAGLPVAASRWEELEAIGAPIRMAESAEDFAEAVRRSSLREGREERIAFALANTWEKRFDNMLRVILGT